MQPRGTPALYFQALNRPFLIAGVQRELFYLLVAFCAPIVISGHLRMVMDVMGGLLFGIGYLGGILMTRADYQIIALFRSHIRYRKYYAAQPGLHADIPLLKNSVPIYQGQRGVV